MIKTKPNNHELHESGKTSPPLPLTLCKAYSINLLCSNEVPNGFFKGSWPFIITPGFQPNPQWYQMSLTCTVCSSIVCSDDVSSALVIFTKTKSFFPTHFLNCQIVIQEKRWCLKWFFEKFETEKTRNVMCATLIV